MTNLSFKERAERLERVRSVPPVTSGSSADVQLLPPGNLRDLRTISAIQSLARRGVQVALAKASIEALVGDSSHPANPVNVHLPRLEGAKVFTDEMAANGVHVVFLVHRDTVTLPSGG
jgi:hypothetical protein